jgi:isopentenyldiphosphate isomerase
MAIGNSFQELPGAWLSLRKKAGEDGYVLSQEVFEQARQVFLEQHQGGRLSPKNLTREYLHEEFLLVVDEEGRASGISNKILEKYEETAAQYPEFTRWFSAAAVTTQVPPAEPEAADGARVLLASRWLCHLIGLRHGTVEIFIDPPHLVGHTLVQVRGMEKFEAPGAFDIPCAGHISGVDTAEEALVKELAEELDLTIDSLCEFRLLKQYNSYTDGGVNQPVNYEFRVLYRAKLKSTAVKRIRFKDGEVAGLAVFSVPELQEMVFRYPERIASGLSDALTFYR